MHDEYRMGTVARGSSNPGSPMSAKFHTKQFVKSKALAGKHVKESRL